MPIVIDQACLLCGHRLRRTVRWWHKLGLFWPPPPPVCNPTSPVEMDQCWKAYCTRVGLPEDLPRPDQHHQ